MNDSKSQAPEPILLVEFKELMVDEMKRLCEACREAAKAKWIASCEELAHVI